MERIALSFVLLLSLSSCNTVLETLPGGHASYTSTTNSAGETIYVSSGGGLPYYGFYVPPTSSKGSSSSFSRDAYDHNKWYLEFAKDQDQLHLGAHYGFKNHPIITPRIGISAFLSGTNTFKDTFGGFDGSLRAAYPGGNWKPFIGGGIYGGDSKTCKYTPNRQDYICEKRFLYAGYAELGVEYKNFQLFWRNYNVNRAGVTIPTDYFIGLGWAF